MTPDISDDWVSTAPIPVPSTVTSELVPPTCKGGVGTGFLRDPQNDAFGLVLLKAWSIDLEVVGTAGESSDHIFAVAVGLGGAVDAALRAAHDNLRVGDNGATGIADRTGNLPGVLSQRDSAEQYGRTTEECPNTSYPPPSVLEWDSGSNGPGEVEVSRQL